MEVLSTAFGEISAVIGSIQPIAGAIVQIVGRILVYGEHRDAFAEANRRAQSIQSMAANTDVLLKKNQFSLTQESLENVREDAKLNKERLKNIEDAFSAIEAAFDPTNASSSKIGKLKRRIRHFFTTDDVATNIATINGELERVLDFCRGIDTRLAITSSKETFTAAFKVPVLPSQTLKCFTGNTPEGELKKKVLDTSSDAPTRGSPSISVIGMGGSGKTISLTALGRDPDVSAQFPGGVYFLQFGQGADNTRVNQELASVVRATGGRSAASNVSATLDPNDAVMQVVEWFKGQKALFLCDDVWSSTRRKDGYLPVLLSLLETSAESFLIFTTRDMNLAKRYASDRVEVAQLPTTGTRAREMLLHHINTKGTSWELEYSRHPNSINSLLRTCAGLPLAIAIVGSALAKLEEEFNTWNEVFQEYFEKHPDRSAGILKDKVDGYPKNLVGIIRASLSIADELNLSSYKGDSSYGSSLKPSVMFEKLCVMEKQTTLTIHELQKLWKGLNKRGVNLLRNKLVGLSLLAAEEGTEQARLVRAHDLVLDFCTMQAKNKTDVYKNHHINFLEAYIPISSPETLSLRQFTTQYVDCGSSAHSTSSQICSRKEDLLRSLDGCTRKWWELPRERDNDYIINNLARILVCADSAVELVGVLTHCGWTRRRLEMGTIAPIMQDFDRLIDTLSAAGRKILATETIRDTASDLFFYLHSNMSELPSQVQGRLFDLRYTSCLLDRYMRTSETVFNQPWLKPTQQLWPKPSGPAFFQVEANLNELEHVGFDCEMQKAVVVRGDQLSAINIPTRSLLPPIKLPFPCLAVSPDGELLALRDGSSLHLWNRISEQFVWKSPVRFDEEVRLARWSVDKSTLAVAGYSHLNDDEQERTSWVAYIDVSSGRTSFLREQAHGEIFLIEISSDGRHVVSASTDRYIRVWDIESSRKVWEKEIDSSISLSIHSARKRLLRAGVEQGLRLWRFASREEGSKLFESCVTPYLVAIDEDGDRLISVNNFDLAPELQYIQIETGNLISICQLRDPGMVSNLQFCGKGCHATFLLNGTDFCLWDISRSYSKPKERSAHSRAVNDIQFTNEGKNLTSTCRNEIKIWDLPPESPKASLQYNGDKVYGSGISEDGKAIVTLGRGGLCLWNGQTGELIKHHVNPFRSSICAVEVSGDGSRSILSSDGITLRIWDHANDCFQTKQVDIKYPAVSWNGRRVAGFNGRTIIFCDIAQNSTKEIVMECEVWSAALTRDGSFLVFTLLNNIIGMLPWGSNHAIWCENNLNVTSFLTTRMQSDSNTVTVVGWKESENPMVCSIWGETILTLFDVVIEREGHDHSDVEVFSDEEGNKQKSDLHEHFSEMSFMETSTSTHEATSAQVAQVTVPYRVRTVSTTVNHEGKEFVACGGLNGAVSLFEVVRNECSHA